MKTKLKPCPFCGKKHIDIIFDEFGYIIQCYNCDVHVGEFNTKEEATEAWNTRAYAKQNIPTDEEIRNEAFKYWGSTNTQPFKFFQIGAKWMRDQITPPTSPPKGGKE